MNDFDEYVRKYCVKHEVSPEEAKQHATVRAVASYYEEQAKKHQCSINGSGVVTGGDCK